MCGQQLLPLGPSVPVGAELIVMFGAAITVPFIVLRQGQIQTAVGRGLKFGAQGRSHHVTGAVGLLAVVFNYILAHHLGNIGGFQIDDGTVQRGADRGAVCDQEMTAVDIVKFQHAAQHIRPACHCLLGTGDGVGSGRRFG